MVLRNIGNKLSRTKSESLIAEGGPLTVYIIKKGGGLIAHTILRSKAAFKGHKNKNDPGQQNI